MSTAEAFTPEQLEALEPIVRSMVDARLRQLTEKSRARKTAEVRTHELETMRETGTAAPVADLPAPSLVDGDPKVTREEAAVFWELIAPHGDKLDKDLRRRYVRERRVPHRSNALRALQQAGFAEIPADMDRLLGADRETAT